MNSRPAQRRRTDQRSDQDRIAAMTSEQRQAAYLFRLSTEVKRACAAFLVSRNLPANVPFMDWQPRQDPQSPPQAILDAGNGHQRGAAAPLAKSTAF